MRKSNHRLVALCVTAAVLFAVGSARAEAQVFYVNAASTSPATPYANPETAATTIADALVAAREAVVNAKTAESAEVRIIANKYTETGFTLDFPVAIIGDSGNPEDVEIVDAVNGSRAFTISHADAKVANLTISGTGLNGSTVTSISSDNAGGHIKMSKGTVENCVITGGRAAKTSALCGSGGNVWMSGGTLTHTKVFKGSCNYQPGGVFNSHGAGIYAEGSAIIENCLVAGNGHPTEKNLANGIYAKGNVKIINCTIIANSQNGLYVDSSTVKVANTVIYGHGTTDINGQMGVYSHCAAAVTNASCATWSVVSSGDFVSYQGGDYHLSAATSLIDAGTRNEAWVPQPQATEDLDGFMRVSGDEIDVGCYEFDQSKVSFTGQAEAYAARETSNVVFHATATGGSGSFEYQWDFGDGTIITTDQADYSYAYPTSGLFRVRLTARETGSSEWLPWFETAERMVVAPPAMYLDTHNTNPVYPYKTKATAATNLADLFGALTNNISGGRLAFDHYEIRVCEGKHALTGITLNDAISIVGDTGDPKDVEIVDAVNGSRAFEITHADAKVANLTISGTGLNGQEIDWSVTRYQGGHIKMSKGTVENCVITGGRAARPDTIICGQGGNVWMSGGRLVRTKVEKGSCNYRDQAGVQTTDSQGAGVYAEGTAIIDNCLVAGNGHPTEKNLANGIYAKGNVKIVNCTIVTNSQKAVYLDSANVRVVNTVLFGNGNTIENEFGDNGRTNQFSHCASAVANGGDPDGRVIDEKAFCHYDRLAEDVKFLRAASGSKLISGGTKWAEYEAAGAISTLDLLGNPRLIGKRLDIGAIEGAVPGMAVRIR